MLTPNVKFVPTVEEDRSFFVYVHHTAYRDVIEKMFGWDVLLQNSYANASFDDGGIQLIWLKNERIGVVGRDILDDCLWLKELFILPNYQGQGIGSYVVSQAIKQSIELGKELRLRTLKVNLGAKRLYERHGLSVIKETDIHWVMTHSVLN